MLLWNLIALTMNLPFLFLQSLLSLGKHFLSFCKKWRHFNVLNRSFSGMGEESFVRKILLCRAMTVLRSETQRGQINFNWQFLFRCSPDFEWKSNWTRMTLRQVISRVVALASCSWISATYHNRLAVVPYVMNPFCQRMMILPVWIAPLLRATIPSHS